MGAVSSLHIPQLNPDTDTLTAALAYAKAGWYVLPVRRGTKKPGSVVGKSWHSRSSRDPKQITAWFAGTDHDIALHCGRSGAGVFDVDNPAKAPDLLRKHLATAPFQSTRPDMPRRGHYVFLQAPGRTLGNGTGRLGGAWGEIRGLNGVIMAEPSHHKDGGQYRWERPGSALSVLPAEIADLLDDASPAVDAATDVEVAAFIAEHRQASRAETLAGFKSALRKRFDAGESRHQSTVSVLTGAMKEARLGLYPAQAAIDAIEPMFIEAVAKPPTSGKQGAARNGAVAKSEFNGILAWAVAQARGANLNEIRARIDEKMPNNTEWIDDMAEHPAKADENTDDDDETVRTVPWPTLNNAALHGVAGQIVNLVAPHTEADPAAILIQLLAVFGATIGAEPHFVAGNDRHQAIINPLIVGRTNNGAKGTSLGVVEAIRKRALDWFDEFTTSGLSSAEGLIELVRDPSGEPDDKDHDPGVADKRLLVKESEYKSVLVRMRREGNTLGQTLRDAFDCRTLRTLTRRHNRLTATGAHIVVIGHVTPKEFRATLDDSDLSGGTVNRMLICLSRRSRLHSRLGNLPENVLTAAADLLRTAYMGAVQRGELKFTDQFWRLWDGAYRELNRDRPDSRATEATARAVTMVLRLSMLYALIDGDDTIDADHLDAALALWAYADHSAKWLFSSHELEVERESIGGLANFILDGGSAGRTRTEIYRDHFKRHKTAKEISAELVPLVHDGVVIEIKEETSGRPILRYVHRTCAKSALSEKAGQGTDSAAQYAQKVRIKSPPDESDRGLIAPYCADNAQSKIGPDLHNDLNTLIAQPEHKTQTNLVPPGAPTASTPGMTPAVERALAAARPGGRFESYPPCYHCDEPVTSKQTDSFGRAAHLGCQQQAGAGAER